jgi:Ca2+-binding EF-hand superfamily protein
MKLTHKTAGLGIAAVAVLMLGTAAIADNMGMDNGGMMMDAPVLDFAAIDTDKDGKISKDEMTAFRAARVASVDANADGKLSVDEIAAMHLKAMEAAAKTMAQRMVDRMDTDGDKLLSAAEMIDRPMPTDMFDKVDTNKDGFIDQAEVDAAKANMMQRGGHRGGHDHHAKVGMGGPDDIGTDGN